MRSKSVHNDGRMRTAEKYPFAGMDNICSIQNYNKNDYQAWFRRNDKLLLLNNQPTVAKTQPTSTDVER